MANTKNDKLVTHVEDCIWTNEIVPTDNLMQILKDARPDLTRNAAKSIFRGGFPRRLEQVKAAEDVLGAPDTVLYFDCPYNIARIRYMNRSVAGRHNNLDIFEKRYEKLVRSNQPILREYQHRGLLFSVCRPASAFSTDRARID